MGVVTKQFYLDVPDAKVNRVGCTLMRVNANNTIEVRFLSMMPDRDLDRIFVYSTHPKHHIDLPSGPFVHGLLANAQHEPEMDRAGMDDSRLLLGLAHQTSVHRLVQHS